MYILQHSLCSCEPLEIIGIYDTMEVAALQAQVMSYRDQDGERFHISYHEAESLETVQSRFDRVKLNRNYHKS